MKLYEINEALRQVLENGFAFDEETGEVTFDGEAGLEALEIARDEKILSCAKVLKERERVLEASVAGRKEIMERLGRDEARQQREIDRLRDYMARNMADGEKLKDPLVSLYWKSSEAVELATDLDVRTLPEEAKRVKVSVEADKAWLKTALNEGREIAGATLVTRTSLQVR